MIDIVEWFNSTGVRPGMSEVNGYGCRSSMNGETQLVRESVDFQLV